MSLSESPRRGAKATQEDTELSLIDENGTQQANQRGSTHSASGRFTKALLLCVVALIAASMLYAEYARDSDGERIPLGCYTHPCVMAACSKWCYFTPVPIPVREATDGATPTAE